MDKSKEQPKKCFCARCFLPIDPEDKVDIDGQNFHRCCSTCCICRTIPKSLRMFYGHVFCTECFKNHVLNRFKGETPTVQTRCFWMQWGPGAKAQEMPKEEQKDNEANNSGAKAPESPEEEQKDDKKPDPESAAPTSDKPEEPTKRCICARCLQACNENCKIDIGGQSFHPHCARCYFCHCVPTNKVKIYYGQVFCEECFNRHVLGKNNGNPNEFFKTCFEQWQNNPQFSEHMNKFMAASGNKDQPPVVMMMGAHPPFCRCGNHGEWTASNEPRKSVTTTRPPGGPPMPPSRVGVPPSRASLESDSWDLSFENRTEASDLPEYIESAKKNTNLVAADNQKIENLTKYLHGNIDKGKFEKKWKKINPNTDVLKKFPPQCSDISMSSLSKWTDLQDPAVKKCDSPKCLWQCGPIFVNSEYFQRESVCCGENKSPY